jgi:hypothetical protein
MTTWIADDERERVIKELALAETEYSSGVFLVTRKTR